LRSFGGRNHEMRVPAEMMTSAAMLFERNDAFVVEAFRRGEFDYLEGVGEVSEANFFRAIVSKKILGKLAATYPSPMQKHDVPLWVYCNAPRFIPVMFSRYFGAWFSDSLPV
jgi:hypothetical protein